MWLNSIQNEFILWVYKQKRQPRRGSGPLSRQCTASLLLDASSRLANCPRCCSDSLCTAFSKCGCQNRQELQYLGTRLRSTVTVVCIINCWSISPAFVWPPNKLSTSMWDWQVSWTHVPARLHGETTGETTKTNTCTKFLVAVSPNQNSRISGWHAIWWPDKSWGLGPAVYYANSCKPV